MGQLVYGGWCSTNAAQEYRQATVILYVPSAVSYTHLDVYKRQHFLWHHSIDLHDIQYISRVLLCIRHMRVVYEFYTRCL